MPSQQVMPWSALPASCLGHLLLLGPALSVPSVITGWQNGALWARWAPWYTTPPARCAVQVAREVFNRCLMGALGDKTRVLVTNQLQFVSAADTAIFMAGGKIAEIGSYQQLMSRGDSFAQLMSQAEVHWAATYISAVSGFVWLSALRSSCRRLRRGLHVYGCVEAGA